MGIVKNSRTSGTVTESFWNSPVECVLINESRTEITFVRRDGHTVSHAYEPDAGSVRLPSYDGRRFYSSSRTADLLICRDTETFSKQWTHPLERIGLVFPAEDGILCLESMDEFVYEHQTDADGRDIFDQTHHGKACLVKLAAEDGRVLCRKELTCFYDLSDLTHDHILGWITDEGYSILRKSDLSVVCTFPRGQIQAGERYITDGKLIQYTHIRAYGSLYNHAETEIPVDLPEEVLASAERYAWEQKEKRRLVIEDDPPYDFRDKRLHGMVNAEGEIADIAVFEEYVGLWLLTCESVRGDAHCSMCGEPMTEGYAAVDCSKYICPSCFDTFGDTLRFCTISNRAWFQPDAAERALFDARVRRAKAAYSCSTGDFEAFCSTIGGTLIIRIRREFNDGTSDEWYWRLLTDEGEDFHEWLAKFRGGCTADGPVTSFTVTLLPQNERSCHCMELTIRPGHAEGRAWPPVEPGGAEAYERFHEILPNYKNADLVSNPFAPFCTDYEIVTMWSMTEPDEHQRTAAELLDRFAEAVYALGGEAVEFVKLGWGDGDLGHAYRIAVGSRGAFLNDIFRNHIQNHVSTAVIADGLGAMIVSRLGYAVFGGTRELISRLREPLGIYHFIKSYYIFYHPHMRDFYKRKRALVTWATRSERYPDGLYDILHAYRFTAKHRQYIADDTVCGCVYCRTIVRGADIRRWIDDDQTALCPYCGIDAVLPENCGYPVTEEFLTEMNHYWF